MLYGAAVWDPALIIAQIVTLQCLFYLSLGLWQGLLIGPYVSHLSVEYLFSWRTYSFGTYVGWISVVSALLTSALGAVFLVWIVERAKKCLDFAATCFLFHFCFCWRYDGFPARLEWWFANLLGLVIMSLFGEWLCLRREMQEIPLSEVHGSGQPQPPQMGAACGMVVSLLSWLLPLPATYRDSRLLRPFAASQTVLKRYVERARS